MNRSTNQPPIWLCIMLDQGGDTYDSHAECATLCFEPNALYHLIWKSEQADRYAAKFAELVPNDYLEWGTFDVDCVAVDWGVLVTLPGFSHQNGRGILTGELPVRERLIGYPKATKRNDHDMLYLSFTDADDYTDWASCCTGNLVRWVDGVSKAAGMKTGKTLSPAILNRLATLYQYAEGHPAAG